MAGYTRLTLKHALGLAAPHTWPASIFPVLLGTALSVALAGFFSWLIFVLVAIAAILLQSSVNTINDYYDFLKGNDSKANSDDPQDAVLVYNNIDPKTVRRLGFSFMAAAVVLGIYPVYRGGLVTLVLGMTGCLVIIAYSVGKKPISYRPWGELVSGTVMGGLLTLAVFSSFTGYAKPKLFFLAIPLIFGIGLIMMTNNICDIEKDAPIGRKTLPLLLGRFRAKAVYLCCLGLWLLSTVVITAMHFSGGLWPLCLLLLIIAPLWLRLARLSYTPEQRKQCMGVILLANLCVNTTYVAVIILHTLRS